MYTAATETNRSTGEVGKKSGLLVLFALQTRHAAGISSNRKGNEERARKATQSPSRPSSLALTQQKTTSSQGKLYRFHSLNIQFHFPFSFFILPFLQSQQLTNH